MKRCPKCEREFTDAHRFCGGCGGALSDVVTADASAARCPNCGASARAGWKFCGKCQSPLHAPPTEPQHIFPRQAPATEPAQALPAAALTVAETSHAPATGSDDGARCPACLLPVDDDEGDFCEHCGATLFAAAQADFTEPTQVSEVATESEPPVATEIEPPIVYRESLEATGGPQSVEEPGAAFSDENIEPEYVPAGDGLVETAEQVIPDEMLTTEAAAAAHEPEDQAVDSVEDGAEVQASRAVVEVPPTVSPAFVEEEFPIETQGDSEAHDDRAAVSAQREEQELPDTSRHREIFEFGSAAASDQGSGRRWLIPGGVALCLLLAGTVVLFKSSGTGSNSAAVTGETATPAAVGTVTEPNSQTQPPAPEGMVLVSGGSFEMGRNDGDEYERPAHTVSVQPFYIDVHEVTCAQYAKFVAAEKHAPPPTWPGGIYDPANALLPVTGVSWDDAQAYAQWAGGRLPTEEEWEFAARGTDGRLYPWGDAWQPNAANAAQTSAGRMVPVGSYSAGASPSGSLDMVGNAWEWTASSLKAYPGGRLPQPPEDDLKVIRGNYWNGRATQATTTFRRGYPARGEDYKNTGFRCARDLVAVTR
jgi:formylglycine-generating enzyme required for sulfatase activity